MKKISEILGDTVYFYSIDSHRPYKYSSTKFIVRVTIDGKVRGRCMRQPMYDDVFEYLRWSWVNESEVDFIALYEALDDSVELNYYFNKYEKNSPPKKRR